MPLFLGFFIFLCVFSTLSLHVILKYILFYVTFLYFMKILRLCIQDRTVGFHQILGCEISPFSMVLQNVFLFSSIFQERSQCLVISNYYYILSPASLQLLLLSPLSTSFLSTCFYCPYSPFFFSCPPLVNRAVKAAASHTNKYFLWVAKKNHVDIPAAAFLSIKMSCFMFAHKFSRTCKKIICQTPRQKFYKRVSLFPLRCSKHFPSFVCNSKSLLTLFLLTSQHYGYL